MIYFNRGIIQDGKEAYIVRLHSTNAAALTNSASDYVEGTFYARTPIKQKRTTGEKSIIYTTGLQEIQRNISIQKSIILRSGLIKSSDSAAQEFLNRLLRRGVLNIKTVSGSTWQLGYCNNVEVDTMEANQLYKYDFEIVFGLIEEVV